MPEFPFDYAVIRVVPRVERQEFLNVGVVVYAPTRGLLACKIRLDRARLLALNPRVCVDAVELHLEGLRAVCQGSKGSGPVGSLSLGERFHWLVHPRSAVLQTSAVHAGVADELDEAVIRLFEAHVA